MPDTLSKPPESNPAPGEQMQAAELQELQAKLLEHAYEPIIAWELNTSIVSWNDAAEELFGFSSSEAIGHSVRQLLQTTYPIAWDEIMLQLDFQKSWSGEIEYITSQGAKVTIESHFKLIRLSNGRTLVLQSDRDISMYKQAEAAMREVYEELEQRVEERTNELAEANKALESFSYSVSHDLRAPLRSLEGFTRILEMDYSGKLLDTRALDLMQRMTVSVTRMGQLIEDLLKLSQVSRTVIHPKSVDLSAIALSILDDLAARDPERKVNIEIEPGMTAFADPGLLRVILENLLGNAWKFTGKTAAAQITVGSANPRGNSVHYFVKDNGAGFDMEFADQLFAPFQRLHGAAEFEGTGIGLATVQRVIHRHAGRIWAESNPGFGATFFFNLGTANTPKGKLKSNDGQ